MLYIQTDSGEWTFANRRFAPQITANERAHNGRVAATMNGRVIDVRVEPNQQVKRDEILVSIEAMKMEHHVIAPMDGTIQVINVSVNDQVKPGQTMVDFHVLKQVT